MTTPPYRTTELELAAFLKARGHRLLSAKQSGKMVTFEFTSEAAEDVDNYFSGAESSARELFEAHRSLRALSSKSANMPHKKSDRRFHRMSITPLAVDPAKPAQSQVLPAAPPHPSVPPAAPILTEIQRLGIHTPESLDSYYAQESQRPFVVESFLSASSIAIIVGDSGLGKSPLTYQLALCVAAELPWLGMRTRGGRVLYLDLENGISGSKALRDSVMQRLRLSKCPESFLVTQDVTEMKALSRAVKEYKPGLVVIDTLRAFDSSAEENNTNAGAFLKSLRDLTRQFNTSFCLVHQTKKQDKKGFMDAGANANLEKDSPMSGLRSKGSGKSIRCSTWD